MKKNILTILLLTSLINQIEAQYWSALGAGVNGDVKSLVVYNGSIYAGGYFTIAGGVLSNNIAKWDGANWSALGTGINGDVYIMAVYNGELYVGGVISFAGDIPVNNIAKWNGTAWSDVGGGMNDIVFSLAVFNGELYAGGYFNNAGGNATQHIAKWNGTSWSAVGAGTSSTVISLLVHDGQLYAGGEFYFAGGLAANHIAKWDGTNWSTVGTGTDNAVLCMSVFNGALHAAGWFSTAGGIPANLIAKWDGTNWSPLGNGLTGGYYGWGVQTLAVYNNTLIAGGEFAQAGTVPATNIARWDGTDWTNIGDGTDNVTLMLCPQDSSIYVGGYFSSVNGNIPANGIAKWMDNCSGLPPQPDIINGNNAACQGSTQTYSVNPVPGALSYTWILPPGWSGSSTSNTLTTTTGAVSGIISVSANNVCGASIARSLLVSVSTSLPLQPAIINGNNTVCEASSQVYSVNSIAGVLNHTWTLPSGWSGNSSSHILATTAGINSGIISVTADNACGSSTPQIILVIVKPLPSSPGSITGNHIVCEGNDYTYSVSPAANTTNYSWILPHGWTGNSTTNIISVTAGANNGVISVAANNDCGSSVAQVLPITLNTIPAVPTNIIGNSTICEGSSQTYSITPVPGATGYAWDLSFGWSGGMNDTSITINVPQSSHMDHIISVSAYNDCGNSDIQVFPVIVNPLPWTDDISGNTKVCRGSVQNYHTNALGATNFTWTIPPGWVGNSTTNSITLITDDSDGIISVKASNDCGTSITKTIIVSVDSVLSAPGEITGNIYVTAGQSENYSINTLSGINNYSWSLSGGGTLLAPSQNSIDVTVKWLSAGIYTLSVKANNSCGSGAIKSKTIIVAEQDDKNIFDLKLFPNPSQGEFYVSAKRLQDKLIRIEVLNMSGQIIYRSEKLPGSNNYSRLIDLKKYSQGMYVVKIIIDNAVYVRRIVLVE